MRALLHSGTDRGPWVVALVAAGYQVYAINPLQAARYRERYATSGAKSDARDPQYWLTFVRLDRDRHRPVAGDSPEAEGLKALARAHKTLIWDRQRQLLRFQAALRDHFPASLEAFDDLTADDTLRLLNQAPDPAAAANLTHAQIAAALRAMHRHNVDEKAAKTKIVMARYACNSRLRDATHQWAFCALRISPGVRADHDALRGRGKTTAAPYARSPTGS